MEEKRGTHFIEVWVIRYGFFPVTDIARLQLDELSTVHHKGVWEENFSKNYKNRLQQRETNKEKEHSSFYFPTRLNKLLTRKMASAIDNRYGTKERRLCYVCYQTIAELFSIYENLLKTVKQTRRR